MSSNENEKEPRHDICRQKTLISEKTRLMQSAQYLERGEVDSLRHGHAEVHFPRTVRPRSEPQVALLQETKQDKVSVKGIAKKQQRSFPLRQSSDFDLTIP